MSPKLALLFAVACGLAVANVYYSQPLLDVIAADLRMDHATVGVIGTATQTGYAAGLLLLVPLGDLINRRRLIVNQTLLSALALITVTLAPTTPLLLAAMTAVGALAVVTQILVAYSAHLANPTDRGRTVGIVTSGIIIGILLARTVSGTLADLAGWRAVYAVSAAATLLMAWLLATTLPRETTATRRMPYHRLIASVFQLYREERVLRTRATIALLMFMAFNVFATPMVLPLSTPPHNLSTTEVGLFGLAGAAGALGASQAGRLADRGHAHHVTAAGLAAMLLSWLPIALLPQSLWALAIGLLMFDFGLQSVHVANQSQLLQARPDARSRLTAGYMIFYSIGSATGAITSTLVYAHAGWTGVCLLGATISLTAFAYWATTRLTILSS